MEDVCVWLDRERVEFRVWGRETNNVAHSSSRDDSDQPRHLLRVVAVCMKKAWILSNPNQASR